MLLVVGKIKQKLAARKSVRQLVAHVREVEEQVLVLELLELSHRCLIVEGLLLLHELLVVCLLVRLALADVDDPLVLES